MRVLIAGRSGQVGHELVQALHPIAEVCAPGRGTLDLTDRDGIVRSFRELRPDLVINAAAYTAVDRAESEPDEALAVNAHAPAAMAREAARLRIPFIHYSTDYVFDGRLERPYRESDEPAPVNVYGRTKLLGDLAVTRSGAPYLIFRVAWVYGHRRRNFLTAMLELFAARETIRVVADEWGAPTWSADIAGATVHALHALAGSPDAWSRQTLAAGLLEGGGLYHLGPPGRTSWHGFASEILRQVEARGLFPPVVQRLLPIPAEEWPSAAVRPRNSALDAGRLEKTLGVTLPDWPQSLDLCLREFARKAPLPV